MKKVCILKRGENTDLENEYYMNAVKRFGIVPILVDENNISDLKECSGILLTGGYNKGDLDDYLIEYALINDLPLFGICQGMQSMALYKTDLELIDVNNHYHKEEYTHSVIIDDSRLKDILKKDIIIVNTHHKQMVTDSLLFDIVGRSDDNVIEAIENKKHKFQIGVQWHPERMIDYDDNSFNLFKTFCERLNEK